MRLPALACPPRRGGAAAESGGVVFVDPRLAALGARAILPPDKMPAENGSAADYDRLRLSLGVPDGSRDLPVEKAILLENGFDELNAIDWDKGCYMGQELTARTRYRGLVRKRLLPVAIEGARRRPARPCCRTTRRWARCAAPPAISAWRSSASRRWTRGR